MNTRQTDTRCLPPEPWLPLGQKKKKEKQKQTKKEKVKKREEENEQALLAPRA